MKESDSRDAAAAENKPRSPEKETRIIQLLLQCGLFLQREMNQVCERFGLKQQQFSVLNEIVRHGPVNQKELSKTLLFEKSNISKIVRILLEKKLIDVAIAPEDRRLTLLSETREGFARWKNCMQAFQDASAEFADSLSDKEAAQVIRLLKKQLKTFMAKQQPWERG